MAKKGLLVLAFAVFTVGGVFAAPDMSKYQYFYIDKNTPHWGTVFAGYETEVSEGFETYGLKYLSEKQVKSLSNAEQEKVLMLRFNMLPNLTNINLLDFSTERAIASCKGKGSGLNADAIVKKSVLNAIKDAGKLFSKK